MRSSCVRSALKLSIASYYVVFRSIGLRFLPLSASLQPSYNGIVLSKVSRFSRRPWIDALSSSILGRSEGESPRLCLLECSLSDKLDAGRLKLRDRSRCRQAFDNVTAGSDKLFRLGIKHHQTAKLCGVRRGSLSLSTFL